LGTWEHVITEFLLHCHSRNLDFFELHARWHHKMLQTPRVQDASWAARLATY